MSSVRPTTFSILNQGAATCAPHPVKNGDVLGPISDDREGLLCQGGDLQGTPARPSPRAMASAPESGAFTAILAVGVKRGGIDRYYRCKRS